MKKIFTLSLILKTLFVFSQNFSGTYTSMYTSYCDNKNNANNFKENTLFNITIIYDTTKTANNCILIKDPRIPKKILTYKIQKKIIKMPATEYTTSSYVLKNCLDKNTNTITDIVIYYNKQNELNLMVDNGKSSQAFKTLIKSMPK